MDETLTAVIAGATCCSKTYPGPGKTMLVRTLADELPLRFQRIQFTPNLMVADLIGANDLIESPEGGRRFEFQRAPLFANLVLADEPRRNRVALVLATHPENSIATDMARRFVRHGSSPRNARALILSAGSSYKA